MVGYYPPCLCKSDTVATNVEHWNPECPYHKRRDVVAEAFEAVDKYVATRAERGRYREALEKIAHCGPVGADAAEMAINALNREE